MLDNVMHSYFECGREFKMNKTSKLSKKLFKIVVCTLVLTMFASTGVFAKSYTNKYVYGNAYSVVADGSFDNSSNYMTVTLTHIYKADGTESDYSKVKSDVLDGSGNQISTSTGVLLYLDEGTIISLKQQYSSGTRMKLRMKGNDSSLDCIVNFSAPLS